MSTTRRGRARIPDETFACRVDGRGRALFVVSDLHLGLPEGFGFPRELERTLADAIAEHSARGSIIVLNGDIIEDGQSASPLAVLARTPRLLAALGDAAATESGVYYVVGNHDPAAERLRGELGWRVVPGFVFDERVLVVHGDVFDVGLRHTSAGRAARFHGSLERCLGTPISLPVASHGSFRNRMVIGLGASTASVVRGLGFHRWIDENLDYLASLEVGADPHFVVATLASTVLPSAIDTVLAGHTHRPGRALAGRYRYLNSGTWSRQMATAIVWRDGDGSVLDLVRGTEHGDEAYEGWERGSPPWKTWWSQARHELSPARIVAERLRPAARGRRAAKPMLALTSGTQEEDMIVRFTERMRGTMHPSRADSRAITLVLDGATQQEFMRSCLVDLDGTITVEGLATAVDAIGSLRLGARLWEYDIAFVGDDGRPYRLVVTKTLRALDLVESFTLAKGDILDARGRPVGQVELQFELSRDLGPLIRSFTTRARPSERTMSDHVVEIVDPHPLPPLEGAQARVVAVTGAAGHLGFTIAQQLRDRGYRVLGLVRDTKDRRAEALRAMGVDVREADVLSVPSLTRALADSSVEGIVHTAAPFLLWAKDEQREIVAPMIDGTLCTLHAAMGCGVRRVIMTSAGGAVGHDATGRDALTEADWNTEPRSPYLRGKTEAERSAWELARRCDIDLVTILPTAILGPNFLRHTPVTRLLQDVVDGKLPAIPDFAHSWVDVRDVARAHILAFETPAAHGRYLVSATYQSWRHVIDTLHRLDPRVARPRRLPDAAVNLLPLFDGLRARLLGHERSMTRAVVDELHHREPRYSAARAQRELGLQFIDFDRTLADTLTWLDRRGIGGTFETRIGA